MLSRFENCSMLVLECLAVGTVVVGWQVGGNAEIAGPDLIRLVPFGDTDALVAAVVASVEGTPRLPIDSGPRRLRSPKTSGGAGNMSGIPC